MHSTQVPPTMAQTDREALVALYSATDGPNWKHKTNWGSGAPLSDWYGVTANDQGRVVELQLYDNNLQGMKAYPTNIAFALVRCP